MRYVHMGYSTSAKECRHIFTSVGSTERVTFDCDAPYVVIFLTKKKRPAIEYHNYSLESHVR